MQRGKRKRARLLLRRYFLLVTLAPDEEVTRKTAALTFSYSSPRLATKQEFVNLAIISYLRLAPSFLFLKRCEAFASQLSLLCAAGFIAFFMLYLHYFTPSLVHAFFFFIRGSIIDCIQILYYSSYLAFLDEIGDKRAYKILIRVKRKDCGHRLVPVNDKDKIILYRAEIF